VLAASSCVEVQRLVNATGIITLGNQVIQVGSHRYVDRADLPRGSYVCLSCYASIIDAAAGAARVVEADYPEVEDPRLIPSGEYPNHDHHVLAPWLVISMPRSAVRHG
jgi:hypothetical protein